MRIASEFERWVRPPESKKNENLLLPVASSTDREMIVHLDVVPCFYHIWRPLFYSIIFFLSRRGGCHALGRWWRWGVVFLCCAFCLREVQQLDMRAKVHPPSLHALLIIVMRKQCNCALKTLRDNVLEIFRERWLMFVVVIAFFIYLCISRGVNKDKIPAMWHNLSLALCNHHPSLLITW